MFFFQLHMGAVKSLKISYHLVKRSQILRCGSPISLLQLFRRNLKSGQVNLIQRQGILADSRITPITHRFHNLPGAFGYFIKFTCGALLNTGQVLWIYLFESHGTHLFFPLKI